ncbi:MAG: hypothetical protein Ct9H90mP19_0500 [Gammaproteobacteria bacterium]|nr:MAG: hypothetical protein Ct9H90mP19_0500 [Gammaproteobacteria bacterium]
MAWMWLKNMKPKKAPFDNKKHIGEVSYLSKDKLENID